MFRIPRNTAVRTHLIGTMAFAVALIVNGESIAAELTPHAAGAFFAENCSACHTIGEGDGVGPDLLPATKFAEADLREAVARMEMHIGAIAPESVDAMVKLLRNPVARSLIAGTPERESAEPPPVPRGSPQRGRELFFGSAIFANRGTPCFACHAAEGRGGNLAADLTASHARLGDKGIVSITERPAFPMMKAAYLNHQVTTEEALDLTAFLREAANAPAQPERSGLVHATAGGLALLTLGGLVAIFRRRGGSVRAQMTRPRSKGDRS